MKHRSSIRGSAKAARKSIDSVITQLQSAIQTQAQYFDHIRSNSAISDVLKTSKSYQIKQINTKYAAYNAAIMLVSGVLTTLAITGLLGALAGTAPYIVPLALPFLLILLDYRKSKNIDKINRKHGSTLIEYTLSKIMQQRSRNFRIGLLVAGFLLTVGLAPIIPNLVAIAIVAHLAPFAIMVLNIMGKKLLERYHKQDKQQAKKQLESQIDKLVQDPSSPGSKQVNTTSIAEKIKKANPKKIQQLLLFKKFKQQLEADLQNLRDMHTAYTETNKQLTSETQDLSVERDALKQTLKTQHAAISKAMKDNDPQAKASQQEEAEATQQQYDQVQENLSKLLSTQAPTIAELGLVNKDMHTIYEHFNTIIGDNIDNDTKQRVGQLEIQTINQIEEDMKDDKTLVNMFANHMEQVSQSLENMESGSIEAASAESTTVSRIGTAIDFLRSPIATLVDNLVNQSEGVAVKLAEHALTHTETNSPNKSSRLGKKSKKVSPISEGQHTRPQSLQQQNARENQSERSINNNNRYDI